MKKKFENIENSNITDNSVNIEQKNKDGNNVLNIIIGTGKSKPNYLTLPPFNTKVFEGREKALQEVREKLLNGNTILLINGQGGIGKTTFAAKYWRKYENEYQHLGVLYVRPYSIGILLVSWASIFYHNLQMKKN
jgi:flagellar biosynthesis GTPase FlhF